MFVASHCNLLKITCALALRIVLLSGWVQGEKGMRWSDLNDKKNGLKTVLTILAVEWVIFLVLNFYLDQVVSSENGIRKHPLFFLNFKRKGKTAAGPALSSSLSRKFSGRSKSLTHIEAEDQKSLADRPDVAREVSCTIFLDPICKSHYCMDGRSMDVLLYNQRSLDY
jgi:hypothetical protein